MIKIAKFIFFDILKNKILLIYTLFLFVISWAILGLENNPSKATLNLLNIVLLVVPLLSIVFSTIYVYNSSQFIVLLSSQPTPRNRIWIGIFLGLAFSQIFAFLLGCGLPIILYSSIVTGFSLIIAGVLLTLVFVSFAMLASISSKDRAKGIGIAIFVWIFFNIIYDGILLIFMFQFSDYPIEKLMAILSALNPVGLSRIFVQLQLDVSAMLGYSGAIFKELFGKGNGLGISIFILILWGAFPFLISLFKFNKKDL